MHKIAPETNLNSYLLESTLNFLRRDYAFSRLELVDKDEFFPRRSRIRLIASGLTLLAARRDLMQDQAWQLGFGRGCDGLLEAGRVGRGLRGLSRIISNIFPRAAGIACS